jgi:hypothetical protein
LGGFELKKSVGVLPDDGEFLGMFGLVFGAELGVELVKLFLVDGKVGGESVLEGVSGGAGFACLCFRAFGFGAVEAGLVGAFARGFGVDDFRHGGRLSASIICWGLVIFGVFGGGGGREVVGLVGVRFFWGVIQWGCGGGGWVVGLVVCC